MRYGEIGHRVLPSAYIETVHVLTWIDWPDTLPPSPNFLRLIYAGKLLPDKSTLAGTLVRYSEINL
jgi:hypothetical protein